MTRTTRLLLSLLAVGGMFALGRVVARLLRSGVLDDLLDSTTPVEEIELQTPLGEEIEIYADPNTVYLNARELQYFKQFLFGVQDMETNDGKAAKLIVTEDGKQYPIDLYVIADQPGEFLGFRIEYEGQLYGTCLMKFEPATVRGGGTKVTVSSKYKIQLPTPLMNEVKAVVAREIDVYLHALKEAVERRPVAQ